MAITTTTQKFANIGTWNRERSSVELRNFVESRFASLSDFDME